MKTFKTLLALPLLASMSQPVLAKHDHDGYTKFDQRIERQHKRIKKGVRNDLLTNKETKKLRQQHRFIKRLNKHFQKDGHLDQFERATLQRELDLASKRIRRLKHNDRYRHHASHHKGSHKQKRYGHYHEHRNHKHHRSVMLGSRHYY